MKVTTISTGLALTDAGAVILSPVGVIAYVVQTDSGYRLTSTVGATLCSDATGEPLGPFESQREAAEKAPMLLGYKLPEAETATEPADDLLTRLWTAAQPRLSTDPDIAILLVDARDAVRDLLGANARAEIRIADLKGDAKETKLRGFREGVQALYAALLELPARVDLTAEQVRELEKLARFVAAEGAVKP